MKQNETNPHISIVIPIYNEEGNIEPLMGAISQACSELPYEILAIDDGSTDGTPRELEEARLKNNRLRVLRMKRNFGQTAAMAAGVDHAKGNILVMLDGDGQNDPADIPHLLKKMEEGYEVVSGWRKNRKDAYFSRILPSRMANWLISVVTGVYLHDYGCTLKAYRKSNIGNIQIQGEMHRFLPAWCAWQGGKITEVVVNHHPRRIGKSKYGWERIFKVIIDLITLKFFNGYLTKPNYLFSGTGLIFILLGFFSGLIAFIDKFGPNHFPQLRIPLLLLSVFFLLIAVGLFLMGLLAELLIRLYFQVTHFKPYRLENE